MEKDFDYVRTVVCADSLYVEDIGNCFIEAFDDTAKCYYLWIKTTYGNTKIFEAGPYFAVNKEASLKSSKMSYINIEYAENKIIKHIDKFLSNTSYCITQAFDKQEEYTETEKFNKLYNIVEYMKQE